MPLRDPTVLAKLGVACVSFCGAVYFAFAPRDHDLARAQGLFTAGVAALAAVGWSAADAKATKDRAEIKQAQAEIKADTADIKNNPALPGTPTGPTR